MGRAAVSAEGARSSALAEVSPAQLRHLAFSRQGEVVFRHLQGGSPQDWGRQPPEVLAEGLWGALAELERLATAPGAQVAPVLETARGLWQALAHQRAQALDQDGLRVARGYCRFLVGRRDLGGALEVGRAALQRGSLRFPADHLALQLLVADCLWELGELAEAHALLEEVAGRPYLWPGAEDALDVAWRLGRVALLRGDPEPLAASAHRALLARAADEGRRRDAVRDLARLHGGPVKALAAEAARGGPWLPYAAWLAHFGLQRWRPAARLLPLSRAAARGASLAGTLAAGVTRRVRGPRLRPPGVLVTRAMGGVGDLLMMTPGLAALGARQPEPVTFAVPRPFLGLFEGNPDVEAVDIAGPPLAPERFARWVDLTRCPASTVESRTAPKVRLNRIELFAAAMGVSRPELDRAGRRPRYRVSVEERAWARSFLPPLPPARRRVGVQLRAADGYRDYPSMGALVAALAQLAQVVVFHGSPVPEVAGPQVVRCDQHTLRQSAAALEQCHAFVGPDSAFLHLAAAFELPSVLVAGPVDGRLRASDYPRCEVVDARDTLGCIPCWRHEGSDCLLSRSRVSVCMAQLPLERVLEAVRRALAAG